MNLDDIDVLVIGSGGAGLSAALEAKRNNTNVLVVSKTYPTHSQTCQAQGGINAAIDENEESIQAHIEDTYKGSHKLGVKSHIETLCRKAPETIKWLDIIGVPFSRNEENNVAQRKFGAASKIRTCYSSDYSGLKILHTLYDNCIKENILFKNEQMLLEILTKNNTAYGAKFFDIKSGEIFIYFAKTIIIATGGYSNLYKNFTTNSHSTTGDGVAVALKAGCTLSNMEMIQFHPTAMAGNNILISESARGEGGYLVTEDGERFIDELKPRDEVARAIFTKLQSNKKVYLDLRHIGEEVIEASMPQERRLAKDFLGIDICEELLPINPAAHYCMGGIKTNVSCETSIKNLFACGESAQAGLHGANRLGGNSLQEIVTFGRIAGVNASNSAKSTEKVQLISTKCNYGQRIKKLLEKDIYINFYEVKENLCKKFFKNAGLFRNKDDMKDLLTEIATIEKSLSQMGPYDKSRLYNKNLQEFLEFENLLLIGKTVVKSALLRKESRGAHYRTDFFQENSEYEKNTIVSLINGELSLRLEDVE